MSNFRGAPEDAQNWFVGSADIKMHFPRCSRIRSWLHGKNGQPKTSCSRLSDISCPLQHFRRVSLGRCFSVKVSRTTARSREVLMLLFLFVVTTPHHRCSVANMARDLLVSIGRTESQSRCSRHSSLACGTCISPVQIAGVKKPVSSTTRVATVKQTCTQLSRRIRSVARTVSSQRRISGRAMELVNGHESFLALSNRGALSIFDASFKFAWASYLVSGEPWSTARIKTKCI